MILHIIPRTALFVVLVVLGCVALRVLIKQPLPVLASKQPRKSDVIREAHSFGPPLNFQSVNCEKYGPYASEKDFRKYQDVYYQRYRGYPKVLTLDEAVGEFNIMANCHPIGKNQPPLKVEELLAAVRDISKKDKSRESWLPQRYRKISEGGVLPLGSYIDYRIGVSNRDGYDVSEWTIFLRVGLDKYPGDIIGNPSFITLIRKQYISSRRVR